MASYKVKWGLIRVVDNVSARFEKREVTSLIGESGCGKSTMAAAARLSRNMMVMYGGRIMEFNKTSAVFQGAVHPYTRGLIDSTPFIDSEVSTKKPISGAPPDLLNPPSGCLFHPRCP